MTNRYKLIFLWILFTGCASFGQGIGKLEINADLTAIAAFDPEIEISVINMATNKEMARKKVSEMFSFAFPLNGRFLLYFKKEGYQTTRLMLDTHTFMSGFYTVRFDLEINPNQSGDMTAITIGTIQFDNRSTNFGFKASHLIANQTLKVVSTIRESEIVSF